MKIFSRGSEAAKPQAAPAPAAPTPGAGPAAPPTPVAAPAPPAPDISAILEANVKEMSDKIARLANSVEGTHDGRADFEAKLEKMEERMRKLSSLTEMISAQYNPFVGAAPSEREPFPSPEVGLAAPPTAPATSAAALLPPLPAPEPAAASPIHVSYEDPLASVVAALAAQPPQPEYDAPLPAAPAYEPAEAPAPPSYAAPPQPPEAREHRLWSARNSFESSMLMLGWADLLLKHVASREALLSLLEYYHNIGWIGIPARDQLLAYADGITHAPKTDAPADWRAGSDVHEKSLLYVEKLRAIAEGRRDG